MNYAKTYEARERQVFDEIDTDQGKRPALEYWKNLFNRAVTYRSSCGWDKACEDGDAIRRNDLPLGDIQAAPGWKGKFYKDNWVWKGIKLLVSMLTGSVVDINIHGYEGQESPSQDALEQEVNYASSRFKLLDVSEDTLYDRYYRGYGCAKRIWDSYDISPNYHTGRPKFMYVDPTRIYFDPNTRMRDKSDMRYLFEVQTEDVRELKRLYPQYADKLQETIVEGREDALNLTNVVTLQYRKRIRIDKMFLEDRESGRSTEFLQDEWNQFVEELEAKEEAILAYNQSGSKQSFHDWLDSGEFLPEKLVKDAGYASEEDAVFQIIFMPDRDLILSPPQYVGKDYSYFFLMGYHDPNCAYPFGLAEILKDQLEISVIMMTVLTITAMRYYRAKELIQNDALVNHEDYLKNGYKIGVNPIVKEDWQRTHPNTKAVEPVPLPDFPTALAMLNEHLVASQKTTTGSNDVSMGISNPNAQSGVSIAQLQMASGVYQREEVEGFRRFLESGITGLMQDIIEYRNYPHKIKGLTEDDTVGMIDVATNSDNRLDADEFYVEVLITQTEEAAKNVEKQLALDLFGKGLKSPLDLLRTLDDPNPEKSIANAEEYRNEKEILDAMRSNPEVKQLIMGLISRVGQDGQQAANQ